MHVIVNSDVIHTGRPIASGLAPHIESFCREAASAGSTLVIPRTVLLENERHQNDLNRTNDIEGRQRGQNPQAARCKYL